MKSSDGSAAGRGTARRATIPPDEARRVGIDPERLSLAFDVIARDVDEGLIPGAVGLVLRHGLVAGIGACGLAQTAPGPVPMREDTIFDAASLTKVVATTPAVMMLLERGYLRLDDPVSRFLPAFAQNDKDAVCVRDLLTHSSGLPEFREFEGLGRDEIIEEICAMQLESPPGTKVIYSDLGYIMLAEMVQAISGRPLDVFAREEIFRPLGMVDTMFNPPVELRPRIAATEYRTELGRHQLGEVHDERAAAMGGVAGHAGMFTTARDLAGFCRAFLGGGVLDGFRFLSAATVRAMAKDYTRGLGDDRGLGWVIRGQEFASAGDLLSDETYGHTGFTGTCFWIDPVRDLAVILLTNRVHFGRENKSILRLRPRFCNAVAAAAMD